MASSCRPVARPRRPRPSGPIGPSASRSASHSPTARVCGRRSGSMPAARERGLDPPGIDRAAGATGRCGASCGARGSAAWTSRQSSSSVVGVEPVVRVVRLDDDDRRLDRGLGLERGRRDANGDPDPGVVLDEDRQVAHLPGRRRDPLGDLALDHQHEPVRPRRRAEQRVQDRARDVVRQVGDHVVRRRDEVDEVLVQRVALDERAACLDPVEPLAQERREAAIELDRGDLRAARGARRSGARGRARSRGSAGRARAASARIASSTSGSARKFCDRL